MKRSQSTAFRQDLEMGVVVRIPGAAAATAWLLRRLGRAPLGREAGDVAR